MFSITPQSKEDKLTLYLDGTLDISTVPDWNKELENIEDFSCIHLCTIDFTYLSFIDSTGIGVLLDFIYLAEKNEFALEFENMSEEIHEVLDIVGIFEIKDTVLKGVS
ncbi:STAS domain-containing protein [Salimicrobium flavidum]|uniref:Anti-anti-sigma factor n=1 Tax=Salimicrobium flavidum TaxID=570947 RepID=A0A1N7J164_9BACI|nr:STAS domain-containing protein [Salimicrobium flavidum]SIS43105.1 anti-anti-sigma factor [Salimicrobium flavidum]